MLSVMFLFFLFFVGLSVLGSNDDLLPRLFALARFLLKDGQLWLCAPQAKQIWKCLAENAVFLCDREACFKWYFLIFSHVSILSFIFQIISWRTFT